MLRAFKVIRGHRNWYQSRTCMQFSISEQEYLSISPTISEKM